MSTESMDIAGNEPAAANTPPNAQPATPEPEVLAEHREQAHKMAESYRDDRPTTVLPGSGGMISGTAISDWVDKDGNSAFAEETDTDRPQK
ncbi:hypothetical protein [Nocardia sp. NBC_01388]|uniref:hypothetical protein n=1 Tax=Nocardia sp. NBC_01388 TaxID=2903596 RepID=UPI003249EBE7